MTFLTIAAAVDHLTARGFEPFGGDFVDFAHGRGASIAQTVAGIVVRFFSI